MEDSSEEVDNPSSHESNVAVTNLGGTQDLTCPPQHILKVQDRKKLLATALLSNESSLQVRISFHTYLLRAVAYCDSPEFT